ncbi:MAG: mechanosensitive ion channel family protein [Solirubrobacterales bacterium]
MTAPPLLTISKFVDENADWIDAAVIFIASLLVAKIVDWLVGRNARRVTTRLPGDELSQAAVTRLRLVRRLLTVVIVLIGLGLALAQIDALKPLATTLLASSAVVGVAVGLAARGVLANGVAGMMLATVQPFRIGDVIEWDGNRGLVEDITLSYTFVRLPSGHRLVVPNEAIATSPLENFTIGGATVDADASVWVQPPLAPGALKLLREKMEGIEVNFGDCEADRIELKLGFKTSAQQEATKRIATREQAVVMLADAGMLAYSNQNGSAGHD